MNKKYNYGLFEYDTENIGDEIQSIAARRFIPKISYYFNRDDIDATKTKPNEITKLIMNGWYTHRPENWPPQNLNIEPLLIAMHIEQDALNGAPTKAFISPSSKSFLLKFGPVGARNHPTLELLQQNGIDAYFSGCITLTLIPDSQVKKQPYILAVDVPDAVVLAMSKTTTRPIIRLNTNRKRELNRETKFLLGELWLYLYQSAHAVITTRLHAMLPCLALKTPVLAISGRDPKRYEGLIDLTNHVTADEYVKNPTVFNLDQPPKNPTTYLKIRRELEKTCSNFTGYDSKKSYLNGKKLTSLTHDPTLMQFFLDASSDTWLLEELNAQLAAVKHQLQAVQSAPIPELGIKGSTKSLFRALRRKAKKL